MKTHLLKINNWPSFGGPNSEKDIKIMKLVLFLPGAPKKRNPDDNSKYNFITKEARWNPFTHSSSSISQQWICQKWSMYLKKEKSNANFREACFTQKFIWISVEVINHDFSSKSLTIDIRKTIQVINLIFSGKKNTCLGILKHLLFLCWLTYFLIYHIFFEVG